jgi:hypothetical protein
MAAMVEPVRRWTDRYLIAWTIGSLGALAAHLLRNVEEAETSRWLHSPGWQREIGLFNLALAVILFQVVRQQNDDMRRVVMRAALVLAPSLAANHLSALLSDSNGPIRLHVGALVLNALNITAATMLLAADRRAARDVRPAPRVRT